MNPDELNVQAKARIIWGEDPAAVRGFLTSNGMSAAAAAAKIKEFTLDRNQEIRSLGIKSIVIGAVVLGVAGFLCYLMFASPRMASVSTRSAKGYGGIGVLGLYGLWKLVGGINHLVRPRAEHGAILDLTE